MSTIEILKDKKKLDSYNERYLNDTFEWDEKVLRALKEKFNLNEFREN